MVNILEPKILSLITTDKCTAACHNCCFQCNPKRTKRISLEEMTFILDEVARDFPSVISCVFTGGECTILEDDLCRMIRYSKSKGMRNRIVSNGHWAVTETCALSYLSELKDAGLNELNLSTGDEHQKWVPYERIVYACKAAVKLGLFVAVNVEATPISRFSSLTMKKDKRLLKEIVSGKIIVKDSLWIEFDKTGSNIDDQNVLNDGPCTNLFNTISVSPDLHLQACCGLTCKNSHYLDLGNLRKHSLRRLYNEQFDDLMKLWLYTHGPKDIYTFLCKEKNEKDESHKYPHLCSLCHHILNNKENMEIVKDKIDSIIPSVMLKYQFINKINNK